jgi:hypothetical protein
MRRFVTLSFTLLLLWAIIAQVNDLISGWRVYVFAGGLFVTFAALTQPLRPGMFAVCVGGMICDANAPVTFGVHVLLFSAAHATVYHLRDRVPQEDNIAITVVTLLTNLALFLVFSFGQIHVSPAPAAAWPRLLMDLLCSQILLVAVTPWFFALQARALEIAQVMTAAYERRFRERRT